jgi:pimeloyl-ACP methyl ester carboxylesterase
MAEVEHGQVEAGGIRSPLLSAAPPGQEQAAEAVVLLHGNPGSSQDWARLVGEIGELGRAVAFDLPNFGQADKPADLDPAEYPVHVGRVLDRLGIRRAHLVLHDWGGPWGLAWAARHPDRFASVTLVNTGVLLGYRGHYVAAVWVTPGLGELAMRMATLPGFRLLLRHGNPRGLPPEMVDRMWHDFDGGTRRAVLRLYRWARRPGRLMGPLRDALRPLDRPALVVWGVHDPYIPARMAYRQLEVFPRAQVALLPDSGHWPMADDPEAVAALVLPFLRTQLGAAPGG